MKITSVEFIELSATTAAGRRIGDRTWLHRSAHAAIKVHCDTGQFGICHALASHGRAITEQLAPRLIGEDPMNAEKLWLQLYGVTYQRPGNLRDVVTGIGALDIALWDLRGKILNTPTHRLLGGYRTEIPAYADGRMAIRTPEQHAEWSAHFIHDVGYSATKYHVLGEPPDQVVKTARLIREAIGPEPMLMIDVHKIWDPWTAVETARRLEEHDVFWLEEPLRWDDEVGGMAYLAANTRISVAAGESELTLYACRDLIEHGGIKILQTDILVGGGYTPWLKMAGLAEAFHIRAAPHGASFPELLAPLIASLPNGLIVSAGPAGEETELWSKLYREPFDLRQGVCYLREQPGLGLEFDEDFLAAHRV